MDVCLVYPGEAVPSFGLMSIASVLEREGIEVKIADFSFEEIDVRTVKDKIRTPPKVIGITSFTTPMISRGVRLTRILQELVLHYFQSKRSKTLI